MLVGLCASSNNKKGTNTEGKEYIEQTPNLANNDQMVATYKADIEEVYLYDKYGNNIVDLYIMALD